MVENAEALRVAQQADKKSDTALAAANASVSALSGHEQLCGERYANINRQLGEVKTAQTDAVKGHNLSIEKIYLSINSLNATVNKAAGIDIALRYVCIIIGAIGAVYGILK